MSDVITKIIDGNDQYEGRAVVYVDKFGNMKTRDRGINLTGNIQAVRDRLDNRFDNTNYYSN